MILCQVSYDTFFKRIRAHLWSWTTPKSQLVFKKSFPSPIIHALPFSLQTYNHVAVQFYATQDLILL